MEGERKHLEPIDREEAAEDAFFKARAEDDDVVFLIHSSQRARESGRDLKRKQGRRGTSRVELKG